MHDNRQICNQQGITEGPQTVEAMRQREDGATVYGFGFEGNQPEDLSVWLRACGDRIIGQGPTSSADTPEAIAAIQTLRDLHAWSVLPAICSTAEHAGKVPCAEAAPKVLAVASPPMPAFTNSRRGSMREPVSGVEVALADGRCRSG